MLILEVIVLFDPWIIQSKSKVAANAVVPWFNVKVLLEPVTAMF